MSGLSAPASAQTKYKAPRFRAQAQKAPDRCIALARSVPIESEVARRGGLGLKRFGSELTGPCVRCRGVDRFSISITKRIFNCRGCNASGDVIDFVQHVDGVDFRTAVDTLGGAEVVSSPRNFRKETAPPISLVNQGDIDHENTARALRLWDHAKPISGTIAERYLHSRGLHDLPGDSVLRFHPSCPFGKGRNPCLLSLYTHIRTNVATAISRTALGAAGTKIGRLSLGPTRGAAIKIDPDENVELGLVVGEGLETCLAARQLGFRPCWALGSSAAVARFEVLAGIESLTIITDNDPPDARGRQAGQAAALACSERWTAAGVEVRRVIPHGIGADMADIIKHAGGSQ
jgi:putative DNA primase/helicase